MPYEGLPYQLRHLMYIKKVEIFIIDPLKHAFSNEDTKNENSYQNYQSVDKRISGDRIIVIGTILVSARISSTR